jgi:hypothetical protein
MTFERETYWENRRNGKRGQGELPAANFLESATKHFMQVGTRLMAVSRAAARRKVVDHKFTTKGHRTTNPAQSAAIRERVKRTEAGEKQRVATKKAQALGNK